MLWKAGEMAVPPQVFGFDIRMSILPRIAILGLALLGFAALGSSAVQAENRDADRVYADSFGNLVVHSRGSYKRIVVGKGYMARELAEYQSANDEDDVVYLNDRADYTPYRCWRPAVLLKGRGYMYGLEDGELPDLPGKWCHFTQRAAPGAALRRVQP